MTPDELRDRTQQFALRVIKLTSALPKGTVGEVIARQMIRSATSVGANYRSACTAQSAATFRHRLSIVVEEADETLYWLELVQSAGLVPKKRLSALLDEANQLTRIMAASQRTAKASIANSK